MFQVPKNRPPTHPGEMLVEEFLKPLGMTQVELAHRIAVPFQRVNQIVNRKRALSPDTSLRLARVFGTTPGFWLNLQQRWDLYEALHSAEARAIGRIKPVSRKAS
ncbi:MAG: HigA family addiction module antitoxin [Tepidisphaeraceae bacterium]